MVQLQMPIILQHRHRMKALELKEAIRYAGIEPTMIDYINAHGTSTPYNDRSMETEAIKTVFGDHAYV